MSAVWSHPKIWIGSGENLRQFCRLRVFLRLMDQGHRGPITDCAMRSHFVVLNTPIFHLLSCLVQIHEPVLPETFETDGCIEAFDIGVVSRLAWPTEVQHHTVGVGLEIELLRGKLTALVDADCAWQPEPVACFI